ncbi:hypothetical protein Q6D67_18650 [Haliea sp. E1-2-M8]|uniref:hypothetical protein n=1 Tax=Haliea sp. E1-2-M8 TaxID=3064706 RepID=UPI002727D610|nr:hypothetical protein [Haliea sp. E1-2-M8]MDO8863716.1 hypothetical protein [Haliea sp. E1-2-M8]
MRHLESLGKDYWKSVGQDRNNGRISGNRHDEGNGKSCVLIFEPTTLIMDIEYVSGVSVAKLHLEEDFDKLTRLMEGLLTEFSIKNVRRVGMRCFSFFAPAPYEQVTRSFASFIGSGYSKLIESTLGEIKDFGIALDGQNESLQYHHRAGPARPEEATRQLQRLGSELMQKEDFTAVCDIDVYETGITTTYAPPRKWARDAAQLMLSSFRALESSLKEGD